MIQQKETFIINTKLSDPVTDICRFRELC